MAYVLAAVVAEEALLGVCVREVPAARVVALGQGLALVPLTGELFDAVSDGSGDRPYGFRKSPGGFAGTLARWSAGGAVAYVEAEYFGGTGEQHAVVWDAGALVLGPLHKGEDERFPAEGSPISQALRRLGAVAGETGDEFDAVGLRRHRSTSGWLTE